jgi:hypothetical protein
LNGAFLSMAKIEIGADTYCANMKSFDQILSNEVLRRESRKFAVESNREQYVDAAFFDLFNFAFWRADSFRSLVRIKHLYGMRLKRHRYRWQGQIMSFPDYGLQDCLVTQVETVEVSDAQNTMSARENVRSCRQ